MRMCRGTQQFVSLLSYIFNMTAACCPGYYCYDVNALRNVVRRRVTLRFAHVVVT